MEIKTKGGMMEVTVTKISGGFGFFVRVFGFEIHFEVFPKGNPNRDVK